MEINLKLYKCKLCDTKFNNDKDFNNHKMRKTGCISYYQIYELLNDDNNSKEINNLQNINNSLLNENKFLTQKLNNLNKQSLDDTNNYKLEFFDKVKSYLENNIIFKEYDEKQNIYHSEKIKKNPDNVVCNQKYFEYKKFKYFYFIKNKLYEVNSIQNLNDSLLTKNKISKQEQNNLQNLNDSLLAENKILKQKSSDFIKQIQNFSKIIKEYDDKIEDLQIDLFYNEQIIFEKDNYLKKEKEKNNELITNLKKMNERLQYITMSDNIDYQIHHKNQKLKDNIKKNIIKSNINSYNYIDELKNIISNIDDKLTFKLEIIKTIKIIFISQGECLLCCETYGKCDPLKSCKNCRENIICNDCLSKLQQCPTCRTSYI